MTSLNTDLTFQIKFQITKVILSQVALLIKQVSLNQLQSSITEVTEINLV